MARSRWDALRLLALLLLAGAVVVQDKSAAEESAATLAASPATPAWSTFVDQFLEDYFAANPAMAAGVGRHEFDGQLPDWSASGITAEIAWLEQRRVEALRIPVQSPEQSFQVDYIVSLIDHDLFSLREAKVPFANPAYYVDGGLDPSTYVTIPYAPPEQRLKAFIKYARAVPKAVEQIRANLRTPLPSTFITYGVSVFNGFARFYREDVPVAFAEAKDKQLQAELKTVIDPAAASMTALATWLEGEKGRGNDTYVLGPERFTQMLRMTENITTSLRKLEAAGRADLERNLAALAAACHDYLPGGELQACVDKQNAHKPEGGAVEGARNQLAELKRYILDHNIVSIPGAEEVLVKEAPPYKRENFAYINIPGPYEKNLPSTYFIAPPDPAWPKAEQDAYVPGKAVLLFTSVHEVWPGHFLQFLHSHRNPWRFGQVFVGYAFAEGWAHYGEELMFEQGLGKDSAELHIGQLLEALLRNVRVICAIGLHTQGMTVAQCEQLFRDKAFQDAGNARQQAARGTYDPGYLYYTLGKLMIRKLRTDWMAENPGGTLREFHDKFLSYGGPPIPLVRARMLRDPGTEPL